MYPELITIGAATVRTWHTGSVVGSGTEGKITGILMEKLNCTYRNLHCITRVILSIISMLTYTDSCSKLQASRLYAKKLIAVCPWNNVLPNECKFDSIC